MGSTILVVDDESDTRSLLRDMLAPEGYQIVMAEDGKQALEVLSRNKIDLLITDRVMPTMDGLELLKALREQNNMIPALVISGYGEESLWGEAMRFGAVDYLLKPFTSKQVLSIVRKTLGGAKQ